MRPAINSLEDKFRNHLRKKKWFSPGDHVLVAVSGGVDSVTLAYLMKSTAAELGFVMALAHVNHLLRGKSSARDQAFTEKLAAKLGVTVYTKTKDVKALARKKKMSLEEAGRVTRYEFLRQTAKRHGYKFICTAHHRDDQAETVLMRLIKGTGLAGLSGIRERRGNILRPMLSFSRQDIVTYAKSNKIYFVTDKSNSDTAFLRNKIRNKLLPVLKKSFDPQVSVHLDRLSAIARDADILIMKDAERLFLKHARTDDGYLKLDIQGLERYLPLQRFTLMSLFFDNIRLHRPDWNVFLQLEDLTFNQSVGKQLKIQGVTVRKSAHWLVFSTRKKPKTLKKIPVTIGKTRKEPGFEFAASRIDIKTLNQKNLGKTRLHETIDAAKIRGNLILRFWRDSDRFKPLGMDKEKLLSDFFTDQKIPFHERCDIPLLCDERAIIWICGHRIHDDYKITPLTKTLLQLDYRPA